MHQASHNLYDAIQAAKQRVAKRHAEQMAWVESLKKPTPEQQAAWLQYVAARGKQ